MTSSPTISFAPGNITNAYTWQIHFGYMVYNSGKKAVEFVDQSTIRAEEAQRIQAYRQQYHMAPSYAPPERMEIQQGDMLLIGKDRKTDLRGIFNDIATEESGKILTTDMGRFPQKLLKQSSFVGKVSPNSKKGFLDKMFNPVLTLHYNNAQTVLKKWDANDLQHYPAMIMRKVPVAGPGTQPA